MHYSLGRLVALDCKSSDKFLVVERLRSRYIRTASALRSDGPDRTVHASALLRDCHCTWCPRTQQARVVILPRLFLARVRGFATL